MTLAEMRFLTSAFYSYIVSALVVYLYAQKTCFEHGEPCKRTYRRSFECRCPPMRPMCVSSGRYYDARCIPAAWLMHGRLWVQPWLST